MIDVQRSMFNVQRIIMDKIGKYFEEKEHYEKWKDYDECGI